jgi:hypothetical protein
VTEKTIENSPADMDLGKGRKAWRVDVEASKASVENGHRDRTIAAWIVEAPDVHPIFPHAVVVLMDLKPREDTPPATHTLEGSTHEIMVANLAPDRTIVLQGA